MKTKAPKILMITFYGFEMIGVRILHALLESLGYEVITIFFKDLKPNQMSTPTEKEYQILIDKVLEYSPDLIGMSLMSGSFLVAKETTLRLKKRTNIPIIWGGVHPTIAPEECIDNADMVCVGEGEDVLLELLENIEKGRSITTVKNIWLKKKNRVIKNQIRDLIQNLDRIPFPDWTNKNKFYIEDERFVERNANKAVYVISTTRGCPFSCTYCGNNAIKSVYRGKGSYLRRRSVENCIKELRLAKKLFPNTIIVDFEDDVFTFDHKWIKDFSKQYLRKIKIPFHCLSHPQLADEKIFLSLKRAGLAEVKIGVQSGSEFVRQNIYRRYETNQQIRAAADMFHKYKIKVSYDFILNCPFETEKGKKETLNLILNLPCPFSINTYSLVYFPKTELTELALKKRLIRESDIDGCSQKTLQQYSLRLDLQSTKEDIYWASLIKLAGVSIFPRSVVRKIYRLTFFKKRPLLLRDITEFVLKIDYFKGLIGLVIYYLVSKKPQLIARYILDRVRFSRLLNIVQI